MKTYLFTFVICLFAATTYAQDQQPKPTYCEELPATYGSVATLNATPPPSLPRFSSTPTTEYRVQVAILRYTDPKDYPFHPSLVARYRPCEQVWVVESRESFPDRTQAVNLQNELKGLGYDGAYITDLVAYN